MIIEKMYNDLNNQHCGYKLISTDGRVYSVPLEPANTDYQAIQKWIAEGGEVIDNGGNN